MGCGVLVRGAARCEEHTATRAAEKAAYDDRNRGTFRERGYGTAWDSLRRELIAANPLCQLCSAKPSKLVHHWNEVRTHPELRLAPSNLVVTCASCHQKIHRRKDGR
jgi:5-methylcytosine-specific restriction protein A